MTRRSVSGSDGPAIQLQDSSTGDQQSVLQEVAIQRHLSDLQPADQGWSAWQVLSAAFAIEALFWGFPTAFGVFQAYYSSLPQFASDRHNVPVIGTVAQGLCYLGAPCSAALAKRHPPYRKHLIVFGWILCICGLVTASFANSVSTLIATQGILYGLGSLILNYPMLSMLSEWWVVRRGMAFGIISAASGLTGIATPLILEALLNRYGHKTALRACAVAMFVLSAPLIPLLKGRLPLSEVQQQPRTDFSFIYKPLFWWLAIATTAQGFGFFMPPIFVPSYAISIGLPASQAAALLAVMAAAQTVGQFVFGRLSDTKLHVSILTGACCVVAAVATVILWGLGKSLWILMLYSVFYGLFAYGFISLRVSMGRAVSSEQSGMLATYSTFVFLQGIGNVMVGPVSAVLISTGIKLTEYGAAEYKGIVIFAGATTAFGAVFLLVPYILTRLGMMRS